MSNSMMRFKGYSLEHNPETLKISSDKNIARQSVIQGKSVVRETGANGRVITGEGKIYGENCIYKFLKLFKLKEEGGSGILSIPDTKPFYAFFSSLEFAADPTPELITYKFVFREDCSKPDTLLSVEKYYVTDSGEDLWDVSYRFKIPAETLLSLNPDIKRADEIAEGTRLKIC